MRQNNLFVSTSETPTTSKIIARPLFVDRSNRQLSSGKPCLCASCRGFKICSHLIFVAVCLDCWQSEKDRIRQERRYR